MHKPISRSEKLYCEEGCNAGIRSGGRGLLDTRITYIENLVLPRSFGSARVKISDSIDVVCSVKASVIDIPLGSPNVGSLEVMTEISTTCNIRTDDRKIGIVADQISSTIYRTIVDSGILDIHKLVLVANQKAWNVNIDLLVLQSDGDPTDACSMAACVALKSTRIPIIDVIVGESGRDEDFDITGDFIDSCPLPMTSYPLTVTVAKIGNSLVLDVDGVEAACASMLLTVSFEGNGNCLGVNKISSGFLTINELKTAISIAKGVALQRLGQIDSYFKSDNPVFKLESLLPDMPPRRQGFLV